MSRFFGVIWILPVVLIFTVVADPSKSSPPPKIKFVEVGKKWENITGKPGAPPVKSLYGKAGDDLLINCSAQYPIQWNISGFIAPREIVKIQPAERDLEKKTFLIKVNIFFLDAENYTGLGASANIACEQIGNSKNRDALAVFVKGNKEPLITPGNTHLEGDNVALIPCPTTQPLSSSQSTPTLYLKGEAKSSEILVTDVVYNPTEGFRRRDNAKEKTFGGGMYICRRGAQSVTITVVQSSKESPFYPITGIVRKFSDESMVFHCSSKTKPVKLIFDHSNVTLNTIIVDQEKKKVVKLNRRSASNPQPILQGKAACIAEADDLIKEWEFDFVDPPQLHLDNLEGEADCLSSLTPKIVQTVRCKNGMDCEFMRGCLEDKTMCNFKKQKQFYGETDTYCWVDELQTGMPCSSVPFSHLNGLVKCGVMDDMEKHWEFFISLDYIRYSHWQHAPHKELVRIEDISIYDPNSDSTTEESTHYLCTASAYLFADSLAFEIHYKNGSRSLIQQPHKEESSAQKRHSKKSQKILELNVKALLDKRKLSQDVTDVYCLAPFWNTTDVLKASKSLVGMGLRRMSANTVGDAKTLQKSSIDHSENFYIGQEKKRLNCSLGSAFQQVPEWLYRESGKKAEYKNAVEVYPELKAEYYETDTWNYYLEFSKVEKKYAGDYQCVSHSPNSGNNVDNTVFATYKLDVSAEPLATSTTVYVGLTIMVLVVVGLAIAAFAVYVQKRNTS